MQTVRLPMQIGLLAATLALAGCAQSWDFSASKLAYALDNKDGSLAVFTCAEASEGQCYLTVGAADGSAARSLAVRAGDKVALPVSAAANTLCYSLRPDIAWPDCLSSDSRLDLGQRISTTGVKLYYLHLG